MAKIMATMAAKTPNEMFETAIFLYLFLLCYYQKTLSLKKKKKKKIEKEGERERRDREYWKNQKPICKKMVLNVEGRGNGIYIENMNTGIVPIFIGSNMPYGLQFSMPFSL
jgi:transposase